MAFSIGPCFADARNFATGSSVALDRSSAGAFKTFIARLRS